MVRAKIATQKKVKDAKVAIIREIMAL